MNIKLVNPDPSLHKIPCLLEWAGAGPEKGVVVLFFRPSEVREAGKPPEHIGIVVEKGQSPIYRVGGELHANIQAPGWLSRSGQVILEFP